MTSIQFFYNRDFPGNALRSNASQALDRLGMKPEMRETEAAPEQVGALLPALAIDGEIVVLAYVAQIQAGSIDIMVMPEKLYQTLKKNEPFADLKELMGEEAFEKFGMQTDTTHISITDSELEQELGVIYDPVCIAVPYSAPNQENAVKWIKSLDSRK